MPTPTEEEIIKQFSKEMLDKINLRHNRYQPLGWTTLDKKRVLELLEGEVREYRLGQSKDEAIDIANYAMFLWYLSI